MSALTETDKIFFDQTDLDLEKSIDIITGTLYGSDGGCAFLEFVQSSSVSFAEGRVTAFEDKEEDKGFGLHCMANEAFAYAYDSQFSMDALKKAADAVKPIKTYATGGDIIIPGRVIRSKPVYEQADADFNMVSDRRIDLLRGIDAYLRVKDPEVKDVRMSITSSNQYVQIIQEDGRRVADIRPLIRMNIAVDLKRGERIESGNIGFGGRMSFTDLFNTYSVFEMADQALERARILQHAILAPAGTMPVVIGAGWPGVLLHEAVGHGLEGDFNRKETSIFSGKIGEQVTARGITIVDQGNIENRRGSIDIDDEGVPSQKNVLVEDGILKGYMQDRLNARLMGVQPTGNGRRQGYAHPPVPRMTNTFMENGRFVKSEVIESVQEEGLYAPDFGGGQVDTTSGDFTFRASLAYPIKNGQVDYNTPLKGATLIGNGPEVMNQDLMLADDSRLDDGIGVCGKAGQGVPVGVGQPTLKIPQLVVGGVQ